MKRVWWKICSVLLIVFSIVAGLLSETPRLPILNETIRNLYFHVPMWFGMIVLLFTSFYYSIKYLKSNNYDHDIKAKSYATAGVLYGVLGIITGMLWAQYTWGTFWSGDPKQNASAIGILMYCAYFVLRGSLNDPIVRARIGSVYNILSFCILMPLLFILPRLTDSLHPGNGGNPAFNAYDLDNRMRYVFYPANVGWILFGVWMSDLIYRIQKIEHYTIEQNTDK